jgi:hypothetical protein
VLSSLLHENLKVRAFAAAKLQHLLHSGQQQLGQLASFPFLSETDCCAAFATDHTLSMKQFYVLLLVTKHNSFH